jgi:hypothetical protein
MLKIVYRISETGYNKIKPTYINNENCLRNACKVFPPTKYQWEIIADSVGDTTKTMIESIANPAIINYVQIKRGPGYPFMIMIDKIIQNDNDSDIIYFLENDYVHRIESDKVIIEGINMGADYVTLYDHPDKYMNADEGGNPYIEDRGEISRVYLSNTCHWKLTNSTTGTFASTVRVLKRDYEIIKKYANNDSWSDFYMFTELLNAGSTLISPIPSYSTHGESKWLSPLVNWEKEINL